MSSRGFFFNANAKTYKIVDEDAILPNVLHSQLPGFKETPLTLLPKHFSGFDNVYVKDESERIGLPSFKILGASWGTFRAIVQAHNLSLGSSLDTVRQAAQTNKVHLVTATDGNHGRAIARMAHLLGIEATIFVPDTVNEYTRALIRREGATVLVEDCDYDAAVTKAYHFAKESPNRLYIQDTSFEGYHEIPTWIVQGYTTMFQEVETQLNAIGKKATHVFTPVGVGSLAHAVVSFCKSKGRAVSVIAVESEVAACLQNSLRSGRSLPISTKMTIMDGINCGTVSDISWPILKGGVDASITISDCESHESVLGLRNVNINAGPCGASTAAALCKLRGMTQACKDLQLDQDSVIVLLNTEGPREYAAPT